MINQAFDRTVAAHSERVVLIEGERQFSYFELHVYVEWMSRYFQSLGVQPGHRLAIFMPNTHEFVISLLGLLRLHGVAVPLITGSSVAQVRAALEAARAHAVITIPRYREFMMEVLSSAPEGAWALPKLPLAVFEEDNIATSRGSALPLLRGEEHAAANLGGAAAAKKVANGHTHALTPGLPPEESERAAVMFFEKSVEEYMASRLYSHRELIEEAEKLAQLSRLTCNDCVLSEWPFAHTRGFVAGLLAVVATGARMILVKPDSAAALLRTMADERVTVYSGCPAGVEHLAEAGTDALAEAQTLRWCWCEGAALSPEASKALQQRSFNLQLL